jgi:hypothetical protein
VRLLLNNIYSGKPKLRPVWIQINLYVASALSDRAVILTTATFVMLTVSYMMTGTHNSYDISHDCDSSSNAINNDFFRESVHVGKRYYDLGQPQSPMYRRSGVAMYRDVS